MSLPMGVQQPHPCDALLQVLSHELRSPLCVLRSYLHVLQEGRSQGRLPEELYLQRMERVLRQMERLVGDLTDMGRMDAGRMALRSVRTDLSVLCRQAAEEQQMAHGRPIVVRLPVDAVSVIADEDRLGQVLANLIGNAVAYSPPLTRVMLDLELRGGEAILMVADEGPGIAPEHLPRIFDRFYRGGEKDRGAGLGLGLAICKELVARQDGRIWVESTLGQGSTFFVALPLAPV